MVATAVITARHGWAEGNDCSLLLRWRGPLVARAIVSRVFSTQTPPVRAQLFVIFVRVSVPSRGGSVSRVDFDQYAGQYDLTTQTNFFDGDSGYFARYKIELAQQLAGPVNSVLDFSMPYLREVFPKADIVGCDPSAESLVMARRENPSCRFTSMDEVGTDAKFDLMIASCVFHPIPPHDRQMAIRYCYIRLKEGGHFVIFEHNPINPVTRHLVKNCPFDADAVLLSTRETAERMRNAHLHIDESSYCLFFPQQLAALRRSRNIFAGCRWADSISSVLPIRSGTPPDRGFHLPARPSSSLRNVLTAFCAP
jgi:SAM-dependent methyltransferase